ncbi:ankyrin repeat-containing protein [Anaeramoeba ignava]|uniref:Ankyrin repeat-containing protein n=1 Tax=Anaeramoeba ignava TaxID=1746090 RepID=A0A9Q0R8R7_ANAIG|nr:ankyrin repeat-containing protein [Anaeramoeba ignava]
MKNQSKIDEQKKKLQKLKKKYQGNKQEVLKKFEKKIASHMFLSELEFYISNGADPTIRVNQNRIHFQAKSAHVDDVQVLIYLCEKYKKNLDDQDEGNTPLHYACLSGIIKNAKMLFLNGANPYILNNEQKNAAEMFEARHENLRQEFIQFINQKKEKEKEKEKEITELNISIKNDYENFETIPYKEKKNSKNNLDDLIAFMEICQKIRNFISKKKNSKFKTQKKQKSFDCLSKKFSEFTQIFELKKNQFKKNEIIRFNSKDSLLFDEIIQEYLNFQKY